DALSSPRAVVISGSACPPELARTVEQRLPAGRVLQLWGMTELQIGALTRPEDGLDVRTTTAGSASPGTELRITSPDGASVPPDTEGELEVHGSSVFRGYLDNPAANAAAFTADGWFRTGDLAVLDAAGHVRITGRLKDLVNRGGVKINPADVEALLNEHPAILESAIAPCPIPCSASAPAASSRSATAPPSPSTTCERGSRAGTSPSSAGRSESRWSTRCRSRRRERS